MTEGVGPQPSAGRATVTSPGGCPGLPGVLQSWGQGQCLWNTRRTRTEERQTASHVPSNTSTSHQSILAAAQVGGTSQDPSSEPHVVPKAAHPSAPVAGGLRQAADGCCARQAGVGAALQIPPLLTALVILRARGGAGRGAPGRGPGTGSLPWSRWPRGRSQLSPPRQRGGTGKARQADCTQSPARLWLGCSGVFEEGR